MYHQTVMRRWQLVNCAIQAVQVKLVILISCCWRYARLPDGQHAWYQTKAIDRLLILGQKLFSDRKRRLWHDAGVSATYRAFLLSSIVHSAN